jgi:hypothetical protein
MVSKICRYDGGVCHFASCSSLDSLGHVVVCSRHLRPHAFHVSRLVRPHNVSIHDLWRGQRRS